MNVKGANARVVAADLRRKAQISLEQLAISQSKTGIQPQRTQRARCPEKTFETQRNRGAEEFGGYLDPSFTVKAPFIQDDSLKRGEFAPRCIGRGLARMNADYFLMWITAAPRLRYLLGLGFCFRANSSSQWMASVRDSKRWVKRNSSSFSTKSFFRRR